MKITLDEDNQLIINEDKGCRIQFLKLSGQLIIEYDQSMDFLATGSYLLFPWTNRVKKNPYQKIQQDKYRDGNKYPLHGLYMDSKRIALITSSTPSQICIQIHPSNPTLQIHQFIQTYVLQPSTLRINFKVIPSALDPNPYCFGYHPYFQLKNQQLKKLRFQTNLSRQLELDEQLMVSWPNRQVQWDGKIQGHKKYDSLFVAHQLQIKTDKKDIFNYVRIVHQQVSLKIQSDLKYWQIYTPDDGKRIAIQPMSFHGNIYQCAKSQDFPKLPNYGFIHIKVQK